MRTLSLAVLLLIGCASEVKDYSITITDASVDAQADNDAQPDASLPQCTPLGGPSGRYCNTTDDGRCMTTVCECTDSLGYRIPTTVTPMVGYDGGCDASTGN